MQGGALGVFHSYGVASFEVVVYPFSVGDGDVETAVAGVTGALCPYGPGGGVDEDATVGHAGSPVDFGLVALRGIDRHAEGGGVHHHRLVLVADVVDTVRGGVKVGSHGDRDGLDDFAVLLDDELVGLVVGEAFHAVTDGEGGADIFLAVETFAEVMTVALDLNIDLGAGLPEVFTAPAHFGVAGYPEEGAIYGWGGRDVDAVLGGLAVTNRFVEFDCDGLGDADDCSVKGVDPGHGEVVWLDRAEAALEVEALAVLRSEGLDGVAGRIPVVRCWTTGFRLWRPSLFFRFRR